MVRREKKLDHAHLVVGGVGEGGGERWLDGWRGGEERWGEGVEVLERRERWWGQGVVRCSEKCLKPNLQQNVTLLDNFTDSLHVPPL